jgi:hypothetical protein
MDSDFVPVNPLPAPEEGRTIRCVERAEAGEVRLGRKGAFAGAAVAGRGIIIGWVVAAPVGMPAEGIKPDRLGGLGGGGEPGAGGV